MYIYVIKYPDIHDTENKTIYLKDTLHKNKRKQTNS